MLWYVQLILYLMSAIVSFFALSNLEWAKIIRSSKKEVAWFTYVIISLAVTYLIGRLLIEVGIIFQSISSVT